MTIFKDGTPPPLALVAAENAAAKMTVKVLRTDGGVAAGIVRALDLKGSPIAEAHSASGRRTARLKRRSTSGRTAQRHRAA